MTDETFGRTLSAWLHEEAGHRVPDHLAEALVQTAATRQRPWWSSLERLLPMTTTTMSGRVAAGRPGVMLALVALLLLAIAGVALLAGMERSDRAPFGLAGNGRIYVVDGSTIRSYAADGSDPQELAVKTGLVVSGLSISPDGTRLALVSGHMGATEIKVVSLVDGATTLVPAPYHIFGDPMGWSPDGRFLTFAGLEANYGRERLYVVAADGTGNPTTPGEGGIGADREVWPPSYSPDGEWIAFMTLPIDAPDGEFNGQIFVMHPDGSELHEVANGVVSQGGTWAPDPAVQRLLYPSAAGPTVVDVETGQRTTFGTATGWATWSPDAKHIAHWQDGPVVVRTEDALRGAVDPVRVFERVAGDCSAHADLTGRAVCSPVTWSPDGTQLIATDVAGGAMLVAPIDGSAEPVRIPLQFSPGLNDKLVAWQPVR